MIYPFMALDDETEIVHSEILLIMQFSKEGGFENAPGFSDRFIVGVLLGEREGAH